MKKYQLHLFVSLVLVFSFLYSDYAKLPTSKSSSLKNTKNKKTLNNDDQARKLKKNKKELNKSKKIKREKSIKNPDLTAELAALEQEFQIEKAQLKKRFLTEKETLRKSYKNRKAAIYNKYGVNPPKNNDSDSDPSGLWKSIE